MQENGWRKEEHSMRREKKWTKSEHVDDSNSAVSKLTVVC